MALTATRQFFQPRIKHQQYGDPKGLLSGLHAGGLAALTISIAIRIPSWKP
jgi:hypothetical protein